MSFKCFITGRVVQNEICNKVVIEKRVKEYKNDELGTSSVGWEIAREVNVSAEGMRILKAKEEKAQE